ncbi:MAG: hypothetical protein ACK4IS_07405 [Erythrobacter sp.]
MICRHALCAATAGLALLLGACDFMARHDAPGAAAPHLQTADPVVARALHDPLMSDPDLARRSEANALLAFSISAPLPIFTATAETAAQAREAARAALLEGGAIPQLTALSAGAGGKALGDFETPGAILAAAGAPPACRQAASGFAWAARLSGPAKIAPLGAAELAAGSDAPSCRVRVVRYFTAAPLEDALGYHDALAQRAGFSVKRYDRPEAIISATGKQGENLRVHVRAHPTGMNAVDLVFWINP